MKKQIQAAAFITALIFSVSIINAQTPPSPPVIAQAGDRMVTPPPVAPKTLQEVTAFKGKVVKLVANDDYVYDGFYMLSGSDSLFVKFPPHMGKTITQSAGVGNSVIVNGVENISPLNQKEIRMVSITTNGRTITDTPPFTNTPPEETSVSGSGKVSSVQTNREGRVTGYMLDNNTVLRVPPQISEQLVSLVQQGSSLTYTGNKKATSDDEAMAGNYSIIHCTTLTVNGKQYLVQ